MTKRGIPVDAVARLINDLDRLPCFANNQEFNVPVNRMCRECDRRLLANLHGFLDTIGQSPSDAEAGGTPRVRVQRFIQEMSAGAAALDDPAAVVLPTGKGV